ncbi:MAG: hypothetical protein R3E63_07270 [Pseudomonadales bacterium]
MKDKFIAKVPETYIPHPQTLSARTQWDCSFNAACWVRLLQPRPCKISLVLKYIDQDNISKEIKVDTASNELGGSMLLSGLVTVHAVGKIIDMGVYLEVPDQGPSYIVDELFVQSADKTAAKMPKLVAVV